MSELIGTVMGPDVYRGLAGVVERGAALVFVADERSKELSL